MKWLRRRPCSAVLTGIGTDLPCTTNHDRGEWHRHESQRAYARWREIAGGTVEVDELVVHGL